MKEKDKLYGKLITNFAKASSSDEALLGLLEDVQQALSFSPDFADKANQIFPTIEYYQSQFSTWDKELIVHLFLEKEYLSALERKFWHPTMKFYGYIDITKVFLFQETKTEGIINGSLILNTPIGECLELSVDEVRKRIKSLTLGWSVPRGDVGHVDILDLVEDLDDFVQLKEEKKKRYSSDIIEEYEKKFESYEELKSAHSLLDEIQKSTIELLDRICENKSISKDEPLIYDYNELGAINRVGVSKDGTLEKSFRDYESALLSIDEKESFPERFNKLKGVISYSLVEFLLNSVNVNYLKKCHDCKYCFIAKILRKDNRFCSTECKNHFHNVQKSPKENKDAVEAFRNKKKETLKLKEYENRIQHMVEQGWTEKKAKEMLNNLKDDL